MNKRNGLTNREYHDVSKDAIKTALIFLMEKKNYAGNLITAASTYFYTYITGDLTMAATMSMLSMIGGNVMFILFCLMGWRIVISAGLC